MNNIREIAFDTETTGLDPAAGHRIVEIGCVEMINQVKTGRVLQLYINPERNIPDEVIKVHGITNDFVADKPVFKQVAKQFVDFISDSRLIIHNASFDMKFINWELARVGFAELDYSRVTDTVEIARRKFPGSPASLDALCRRFNIDNSNRKYHGALLDSELLADVYLELTGGRQSALFAASSDSTNKQDKDNLATNSFKKLSVPYREFPPTDEELSLHEDFIKKIKNSLWNEFYGAANDSA